ncbi:T9SS type B sorting domain-containing protein [Arenibacter sp. 6A1]|uniref:Ig-like domain-containing protein n=1 Tax=Arenibacter sp. 6A1 TaxID=2720391 RepID=UPI0014461C70|nr:gliding motility-associated C-terminal domain-containing protein [Arenibacter sp. 6A1]NKI25592.1 T9SS type B sorting domain-containing protein [Arenibacter sp. 6A1]
MNSKDHNIAFFPLKGILVKVLITLVIYFLASLKMYAQIDCLVPPSLSTNDAVVCDNPSVDLDTYVTNSPPNNETLIWSTSPIAGVNVLSSSVVTSPGGTYYAYYYGSSAGLDCYNPIAATAGTTIRVSFANTPSVVSTSSGERCGPGTVNLSATSNPGVATLNWYDLSVGGTLLGTGTSFETPEITNTTVYYVEASQNGCTSEREAVVATINNIPSISSFTDDSRCGPGSLSLQATASSATATLNWYNSDIGGTLMGTGDNFVTSELNATTTFYVEAIENNCISENRTAVVAQILEVPTVSTTTPGGRCDPGSVRIQTSASSETAELQWFDMEIGGSSLATGTTFDTPILTMTTTYYVAAVQNGCASDRIPVTASINTPPTIIATSPNERCGSGELTLGATADSDTATLIWYDASSGGNMLGSGNSFVTPIINVTTTYYVEATENVCTSSIRTSVEAIITPVPSISETAPAFRCDTGSLTLGARSNSPSATINWYANPNGGPSLGTGINFITPTLTNSTTYYVDATENNCSSPTRIAVEATINNTPVIIETVSGQSCGPGSVTLGATANSATATISWFDTPTAANSIGNGSSFVTPAITTTTTYYVEAAENDCPSSNRVAVTATVNSPPSAGTPRNTLACNIPANGVSVIDLDNQLVDADQGEWSISAMPNGGNVTIGNGNNVDFSGQPMGNYRFSFTTTGALAPCTNETSLVTITVSDCAVPCRAGESAPLQNSTLPSLCNITSVNLNEFTNSIPPSGTVLTWSTDDLDLTDTNSHLANSTVSSDFPGSYYGFFYDAEANCASPALVVTLDFLTSPIINSTSSAQRCGEGSLVLGATANEGTLRWYSQAVGGVVIGMGNNFTTPSINATTTFYVEVTDDDCSSERSPVLAYIVVPPSAGTASNLEVCNLLGSSGTTMVALNEQLTGADPGNWTITSDPSAGRLIIGEGNIVDFEGMPEGDFIFTYTTSSAEDPCTEESTSLTITVVDCSLANQYDLAIEKQVDIEKPIVGSEIVFTITLSNLGQGALANVIVNEFIGPSIGFQYLSHTATKGIYDVGRGVWNIPEIIGAEVVVLMITARVPEVGTFENIAAIMDSFPSDSNDDNNRASVVVDVQRRSIGECGFIYNQISPNSDGINDVLSINCIEDFPNNTLEIFNRYGYSVFLAKNYTNNWDGKGPNGNLPKGTYFYVLNLGDGSQPQKGWIQLIR